MKTLATLFAFCLSVICAPVFAQKSSNVTYFESIFRNEDHILGLGFDPKTAIRKRTDATCQTLPVYDGSHYGCNHWQDKNSNTTWLTVHENGGPQGYGHIVGLFKQERGDSSFSTVQTWKRKIVQVQTTNERGVKSIKLAAVFTPESTNGSTVAVTQPQQQDKCAGGDVVSALKNKQLNCLFKEGSGTTGTTTTPSFTKGGKR